jgi:hypothetical protein
VRFHTVKGHAGFVAANIRDGFVSHERYGSIPVRPLGEGFVCDLDYRPPLPNGAERAEPRKQKIHGSPSVTTREAVFGIPRYFYVAEPIRCVDCGGEEMFEIAEQRVWYETYRLATYLSANRCRACREKIRTGKALAAAVSSARAAPNDPAALLHRSQVSGPLVRSLRRGRFGQSRGAAQTHGE